MRARLILLEKVASIPILFVFLFTTPDIRGGVKKAFSFVIAPKNDIFARFQRAHYLTDTQTILLSRGIVARMNEKKKKFRVSGRIEAG